MASVVALSWAIAPGMTVTPAAISAHGWVSGPSPNDLDTTDIEVYGSKKRGGV
jgi:hypothetical protein